MNEPLSSMLAIAADHPAFPGHFPSRPILPGAALLDLAIVALQQALAIEPGALQIGSAKFLQPVGPGSRLRFDAEASVAGRWRCSLSAEDGTPVMQCELRLGPRA
ncbi:hypothetical protein OL229_17340 [Neisseriaceae bacterium JH1-16]|nr:hypothetical protein [Neisseriaceae bacterium JH1-16]